MTASSDPGDPVTTHGLSEVPQNELSTETGIGSVEAEVGGDVVGVSVEDDVEPGDAVSVGVVEEPSEGVGSVGPAGVEELD